MRDPYENILIGNFLYGLGLVIGRKSGSRELPAVVNLLQQTPLDGPLADVYLRYPGVVRLIEFKREANTSIKEFKKRAMLEGALGNSADLQIVSRAIHWYVESAEVPLAWTSQVQPYLDFPSRDVEIISIQTFTERLAHEAIGIVEKEFSDELVQRYLEAVATFAGKKGSSSAILVSVGSDGALRYVALEDIHELRLEHKLLHAQTLEKSREVKLERTQIETQQTQQSQQSQQRGNSYER